METPTYCSASQRRAKRSKKQTQIQPRKAAEGSKDRADRFQTTSVSNYWHPVEAQWQKDHTAALAPLLKITSQTHELVASIATNPQITQHTSTPRVIVERLLLRRLGEELRAVELLAERGHGYQDISSASNLFEQSHFLKFATADDTRATEFLNWSKPRQGMNSIKAIVNFSGLLRSWDTNRIEAEYD